MQMKQVDVREWLNVVATIIMAIFTILLFKVAIDQSEDTSAAIQAASESATATKEMAKAARINADAASRSVAVAESSWRSQEKRDLMIFRQQQTMHDSSFSVSKRSIAVAEENASQSFKSMKIQLSPYPVVQVHHSDSLLYLTVKNFGQTPAIELTGTMTVKFFKPVFYGRPPGEMETEQRDVLLNEGIALGASESYTDSIIMPNWMRLPETFKDLRFRNPPVVTYSLFFSDIWGERRKLSGNKAYNPVRRP
jgi:hypothetical protein